MISPLSDCAGFYTAGEISALKKTSEKMFDGGLIIGFETRNSERGIGRIVSTQERGQFVLPAPLVI
jgi:hypothetical protein